MAGAAGAAAGASHGAATGALHCIGAQQQHRRHRADAVSPSNNKLEVPTNASVTNLTMIYSHANDDAALGFDAEPARPQS